MKLLLLAGRSEKEEEEEGVPSFKAASRRKDTQEYEDINKNLLSLQI